MLPHDSHIHSRPQLVTDTMSNSGNSPSVLRHCPLSHNTTGVRVWPRPDCLNGNPVKLKDTHQIIANQPFVDSGLEDESDENFGDEPNADITRATSASEKPGKEHTKFDVTINGEKLEALPKREAMLTIVRHLCDHGVTPEEVAKEVPWVAAQRSGRQRCRSGSSSVARCSSTSVR